MPIVRHVEIKIPIVVVIEESPTAGPIEATDARVFGNIFESTVTVVEEKHIRAVIAEEDVLIAIVVDVAHHDAVAKTCESKARRLSHVFKSVVTLIAIEPVGSVSGSAKREERPCRKVEVEFAVVVIVEESHTRAVGSREMSVLGHPRKVHEVDAGLVRDLGETKGTGRLGLTGICPCCDEVCARDAADAHNGQIGVLRGESRGQYALVDGHRSAAEENKDEQRQETNRGVRSGS